MQEAFAKFEELVRPAFAGDQDALEYVNVLLRSIESSLPAEKAKEVLDALAVRMGANPARAALEAQLEAMWGNDLVRRKLVERQLTQKREELRGEGSSPLESMLIERIVVCWLDVCNVDWQYFNLVGGCKTFYHSHAEFRDRARDRAHRRFLQAIKALATVRSRVMPRLVQDAAKPDEVAPVRERASANGRAALPSRNGFAPEGGGDHSLHAAPRRGRSGKATLPRKIAKRLKSRC
jgi:hypothetical protein